LCTFFKFILSVAAPLFCKFVNHVCVAITEKLLMIDAAERGGRGCEERKECKKKGDCDERRE
jgi:hypothetical protein